MGKKNMASKGQEVDEIATSGLATVVINMNGPFPY